MESNKHIFLIGMMGTGKTTVGRKLAEQICYPWVDIDQQLEKDFGFTIAEYFQRYGEEAFRQQESHMLQKLVHQSPSVITTGGGIVLREENRSLMVKHGRVVHLTAHLEELIRRLQGDQSRPLLAGNLEKRIQQLMIERAALYQSTAHVTIDTTNQSPCSIVSEVKRLLFKPATGRSC